MGALGLEHSGLIVAVERRTRHVGKSDLDVLALRLEAIGDAAQGAARADSRHKGIHLAISVGPDFLACGLDMGTPVGGVVPLVGPNGAVGLAFGEGLRQPFEVEVCDDQRLAACAQRAAETGELGEAARGQRR